MIKRILFLIVVASLFLAACAPAATPEPEKVWDYKDMTVGFLQTGSEGGWRAANTASFKETAEQLGLTLKFYDSQNDLAKQVAGFQQFIQDPEVDVIVMSPLEVTGWIRSSKMPRLQASLSFFQIAALMEMKTSTSPSSAPISWKKDAKPVWRCVNCSKTAQAKMFGNWSAM